MYRNEVILLLIKLQIRAFWEPFEVHIRFEAFRRLSVALRGVRSVVSTSATLWGFAGPISVFSWLLGASEGVVSFSFFIISCRVLGVVQCNELCGEFRRNEGSKEKGWL